MRAELSGIFKTALTYTQLLAALSEVIAWVDKHHRHTVAIQNGPKNRMKINTRSCIELCTSMYWHPPVFVLSNLYFESQTGHYESSGVIPRTIIGRQETILNF